METYDELVAAYGEKAADALMEVRRLVQFLKSTYGITISQDEDEEDPELLSAYDQTGMQIWTIS